MPVTRQLHMFECANWSVSFRSGRAGVNQLTPMMPSHMSNPTYTDQSIRTKTCRTGYMLYKLRSVQNTGTCYPGQGWFVRNLG